MRIVSLREGRLERLEPADCSCCWGWCWLPRGKSVRYRVAEPYCVAASLGARTVWVTVPAGFLTDGATCGPDCGVSYLFHDLLYEKHRFDDGTCCTREQADQLMTLILEQEGRCLYARVFDFLATRDPCSAFSDSWAGGPGRLEARSEK